MRIMIIVVIKIFSLNKIFLLCTMALATLGPS